MVIREQAKMKCSKKLILKLHLKKWDKNPAKSPLLRQEDVFYPMLVLLVSNYHKQNKHHPKHQYKHKSHP